MKKRKISFLSIAGMMFGLSFSIVPHGTLASASEAIDSDAAVAEVVVNDIATPYTDLQTAFTNATSKATVRLLQDVELTKTLSKGKNLTALDFNGYKIICPNTMTITDNGFAAINVQLGAIGGKFTLKDSSESGRGGIFCEDGSNAYCIHVAKSGLTLNIESGHFYGITTAINLQAGKVNISGGHFAININDTKSEEDSFVLNRIEGISASYSINVTGGTFYNFDPAHNIADGENTNYVANGYKTTKNSENWYTVSKLPVQVGNTYYETIEQAIVDMNTMSENATLTLFDHVVLSEDLIINNPNAQLTLNLNGFTIEGGLHQVCVSSNVVMTGQGTLSTTHTGGAANEASALRIYSSGEVTLDGITILGVDCAIANSGSLLVKKATVEATTFAIGFFGNATGVFHDEEGNGSNISVTSQEGSIATAAASGLEDMHVTIYNGNYVTTGTNWDDCPVYWASHGQLTIYDGNFENTTTGTGAAALYVKNGTVVAHGGTYLAKDGVKADASASDTTSISLSIDGGTYHGTRSGIYCSGSNGTAFDVSVSNGTFIGDSAESSLYTKNTNVNLQISGGSYYEEIPAAYLSENSIVSYDETTGIYSIVNYVCSIGEKKYFTLQEAVDQVADGETITLLGNCSGSGVKVPSGKNFTLDLGGFSYLVDGTMVGSTGTMTNGFQLLKDSNITIRNGSITGGDEIRILIQNYSNLNLDHVHLIGGAKTNYVLSNNYGNTILKNNTTITALDNACAFDVYYGMSAVYDDGVTVTIEDSSVVIQGHVEYAQAPRVASDEYATDHYAIVVPENYELDLANGLQLVSTDDGKMEVVNSSIYLAQQFAADWRAMRVSGGEEGICGLIHSDTMLSLLNRYEAMNEESKAYLDIANDGDCSIGDSIAYVQTLLANQTMTENTSSLLFSTHSISAPLLVVLIAVIPLMIITWMAYIEKKKYAK